MTFPAYDLYSLRHNLYNYMFKKRDRTTMNISWVRLFTFYNKTAFYYKVKIIFFFISQIHTSKKPLTYPKPLINFSCSNHGLHMFCAVLKELHEFGSLYFIKDNITCQSYMTFIRQFVYGTYSSKLLPYCFKLSASGNKVKHKNTPFQPNSI